MCSSGTYLFTGRLADLVCLGLVEARFDVGLLVGNGLILLNIALENRDRHNIQYRAKTN